MFTNSNAVLVAVTQVGVIVLGILAAGVSQKIWTDTGIPITAATSFFLNFGFLFLAIPLLWISTAIALRQRPSVPEEIKTLAFWSGSALIVSLAVFELYVIFRPWLNVMSSDFSAPEGME